MLSNILIQWGRVKTKEYNTKVIYGSRITDCDFKFNEGNILELSEYNSEPVKIVKNDKLIGYGEIVVMDESFGVKVLEVVRS